MKKLAMKTKTFALALLLATTSLAGCGAGAKLDTPSGFATLEKDDDYSYRSTSARGVVLATRTEPNDVKANTEFWAEALDLKLREKGYVSEAKKSVRTDKGLTGEQIRYTTTRNGRPHRYWLTVFATKSKVFVVEAAGEKEAFDKAETTIDKAVASLDASP
jgi:hypothetical protein